MPETKTKGSQLQDFAKELGCKKGLDPMPPDQYLTYQDKKYSPPIRLWAWMMAHTIRLGKRKAWAVDEAGNPLSLKHAGADLGMDHGNIGRAWRQLEAEGRVHKQGKLLRINGDFKLKDVAPEINVTANKRRSGVYINPFPPYILKQLKRVPADQRKAAEEQYAREQEAEAKCLAEAAAAVRSIFDPRKDSILAAVGVKTIRVLKPTDESEKKQNQLRLSFASTIESALSELVQTPIESIQTQKASQYKPEKSSVQSKSAAASLYSEIERNTENYSPGVPSVDAGPNPPARALDPLTEKLKAFLLETPVPVPLDTAMLERIRQQLTEQLYEQFCTAAAKVRNPRSWAIYKDIAEQVAARGPVRKAQSAKPASSELEGIINAALNAEKVS